MAYKFPGVYPSITDLSGVLANATTTATAHVGLAEFGPVFKPTLVTSLQDYVNKFGSISSKYDWAGYSIGVCSETINENYFVRVVPVGDPTLPKEERLNDASWASANFLVEGSTAIPKEGSGYWYEEITAAETNRDSGAASGLFAENDFDNAFIITATNPNNRKLLVTVADSTINENRAYPVSLMTLRAEGESANEENDNSTVITLTLSTTSNIFADMEEGDKIAVKRMSSVENSEGEVVDVFNGTFVAEDWSYDDSTKMVTVSYRIPGLYSYSAEKLKNISANARVGCYPVKNETTFSVTVAEKVGRVVQTLETFEYCTLYQNKDNYGNSTFVEDVINGSSNYIEVFVNNNFTDDDPDAIIVPTFRKEVPLMNGQSGTFTSTEKYKAIVQAWELYRDRSGINVSLLVNDGYVLKNNVSVQAKMLEIAEARRDCFCLFDVPMTETDYEDASDWRKNIQGFNSYRGAICAPWVRTYDSIAGRANFVMCPSAYVAKIMGTANPWVAPAGLNRGVLTSSIVSPTGLTQYYDDVTGGMLYTDNQINCIIRNPGAGYVNWGQRTCQAKPSALDRINVARTVIYIETVLRDAAKWHIFENNTAYERMQITLQFNSFLNTILSAEGIQRYQVICNEENNPPAVIANNQLVVDIYLWPSYCAEAIILSTKVMADGAEVTVTTAG